MTLVNHDSHGGVIVACLYVCFAYPLGQRGLGGVFALDSDAVAVVAYSCDVAGVFRSGAYFAVDSVIDVCGEVVCDVAFECGACFFG